MKHRQRKKDRIAAAGKGNNNAIYISGKAKKKWARLKKLRERRAKCNGSHN